MNGVVVDEHLPPPEIHQGHGQHGERDQQQAEPRQPGLDRRDEQARIVDDPLDAFLDFGIFTDRVRHFGRRCRLIRRRGIGAGRGILNGGVSINDLVFRADPLKEFAHARFVEFPIGPDEGFPQLLHLFGAELLAVDIHIGEVQPVGTSDKGKDNEVEDQAGQEEQPEGRHVPGALALGVAARQHAGPEEQQGQGPRDPPVEGETVGNALGHEREEGAVITGRELAAARAIPLLDHLAAIATGLTGQVCLATRPDRPQRCGACRLQFCTHRPLPSMSQRAP